MLCFNCWASYRARETDCLRRDLVNLLISEVNPVAILKVNCQPSKTQRLPFPFQLHPKRPLRSEVEKEKRLSRPPSVVTPTLSVKTLTGADTNSIGSADGSSNRNSIITNDSTTSEEDLVPPPLPLKTATSRDSDYSNLPLNDSALHRRLTGPGSHYVTFKPLPPVPTNNNNNSVVINSAYDVVETRNNSVIVIGPAGSYDDRKRPPTPPPKPARNSKV